MGHAALPSAMDMQKRKHPRLKEYDYAQVGTYFVTICTQDKKCVLCNVVGRGLAPAEIHLFSPGQIVAEELDTLPTRFPELILEKTIIMPNHIHLLLRMTAAGASPRPTVMDVVRVFKSLVARRMNGVKLWQPSFHDHVIRDENDFLNHWQYIENNPARWAEDEYYIKVSEEM